jgi:uncharacterized protein YjaZ
MRSITQCVFVARRCDGNLAQMLVSEGLAGPFEEEVLGRPPEYAKAACSQAFSRQAEAVLFDPDFSPSKGFFGSAEVPRWFGYAYGYQRCRTFSHATGQSASDLVNAPSSQVLGVAEPLTASG